MLVHVHPAALVPDVGHLEEVLVQARLPEGSPEEGLMGPRGAAGDHYPVEVVFKDLLSYIVLGVLAACVEVLLGVDYTGQCHGVLHDLIDAYDAPDVDAAVADEHPDAGLHAGYVLLRRVLNLCD